MHAAADPLEGMLQPAGHHEPAPPAQDTRALIVRAQTDLQVREWMGELARFLPREVTGELAEYLGLALLGVCSGFAERNLSPYLPQHVEIIPPLLDEIRGVYDQVLAMGTEYDRDRFRRRAFLYGVHKASYLDWRLYISHTCY
jgi:hypothetical protein